MNVASAPPSDDTVVTSTRAIAAAVLQKLISHPGVSVFKKTALQMRSLGFTVVVYWADLKDESPAYRGRYRCLLSCKDLIECGLGITDLYAATLIRDYDTLKDAFSFTPRALTVNYARLSLAALRRLFNITYEELLFDFGVGPEDYLVKLLLPLSDINTFGLTSASMLKSNWPRTVKRVFAEFGGIPPDQESYQNERTVAMMRPLDRAMFLERRQQWRSQRTIDESPQDWVRLMAMTVDDVVEIGLTKQDIKNMWSPTYGKGVEDILRTHFGNSDASMLGAIPDAIPARQSAERRQHKHQRQRSHATQDDGFMVWGDTKTSALDSF